MRTTLTLADDVAAQISRLQRERLGRFKGHRSMGRLPRRGLKQMTGRPQKREPFRTSTVSLGRVVETWMMSLGFSPLLKETISRESGRCGGLLVYAHVKTLPQHAAAPCMAGPATQCHCSSCPALAKSVDLCETGVEPANLSTRRTNFRRVGDRWRIGWVAGTFGPHNLVSATRKSSATSCATPGMKSELVPDAHLAALAINESACCDQSLQLRPFLASRWWNSLKARI